MVAASMGIETEAINVTVEGDLDLRGTLGVSREATSALTRPGPLDVEAPGASADDLASLIEKTERYCTVLQTLKSPPPIETSS